MYNVILQASGASPQWWTVGFIASTALLLIGYAITLAYYEKVDETPPDVDKSPEQGGAA